MTSNLRVCVAGALREMFSFFLTPIFLSFLTFLFCKTKFNQNWAAFPQQKNMKRPLKAVGNGDHV